MSPISTDFEICGLDYSKNNEQVFLNFFILCIWLDQKEDFAAFPERSGL